MIIVKDKYARLLDLARAVEEGQNTSVLEKILADELVQAALAANKFETEYERLLALNGESK